MMIRAARRLTTFMRHLGAPRVSLELGSDCNPYYGRTNRGTRFTLKSTCGIAPDAKVFTIGSCFAREVRAALSAMGMQTLPDYRTILDAHGANPLDANHINHYNTFSIREEFERALNRRHCQKFLKSQTTAPKLKRIYGDTVWQDPNRRYVFASSENEIKALSRALDEVIQAAIESADAFIITLGLTEVWRDDDGNWFNHGPEGDKTAFTNEQTSFAQNYENLAAICSKVSKPIVLTVSPVPLKRTYTNLDVVVANSESKSVLRAVAGQIAREYDHVTYWPSYEIARATDMYEADGRNVTRNGVRKIISAFIAGLQEQSSHKKIPAQIKERVKWWETLSQHSLRSAVAALSSKPKLLHSMWWQR